MKYELILDVKVNKDAFYWVFVDGQRLDGHCMYAGNLLTNNEEKTAQCLADATKMYHEVIEGNGSANYQKVILSTEI